VPSYEELAAYDDVVTAGSERLREMAWREMRHRMRMGIGRGADRGPKGHGSGIETRLVATGAGAVA
jgi:hypothetical protein